MAAGTLPAIGTKYGPCKSDCVHRDCMSTKAMAKALCIRCGEPIGYGVRFYEDRETMPSLGCATALVHALCEERAIEAEQSK